MADSNTTHYNFILQQPGTNRNTWGGKLNSNWSSIDGLLFTATTNAADALAAATAAMPKAGGTFTGSVILTNAGPAGVYEAGYRAIPVRNTTVDTTLALTDASGMVRRTFTSANDLTIPPQGTVGFPIGTAIVLRNYATGNWNIKRGSGVSLRAPSSDLSRDFVITAFGCATIVLEDTNTWVIQGSGIV